MIYIVGMDHAALSAFKAEADRLTVTAASFSEEEWHRPSNCPPWTVRELLAHIWVVIDWLPAMLAAEAPPVAEVTPAAYYRRGARFDPAANDRRLSLAADRAAAHPTAPSLLKSFEQGWRHVHAVCAAEPATRVVRTRHGDAMLLSDFLITRLVELGVHGLDLALSLDRAPWLTAQAGTALETLLLAGAPIPNGWDRTTFLAKATGRRPLSPEESTAGITWLTLG
jgi:uncharacterized protein (TIGR03083 family)